MQNAFASKKYFGILLGILSWVRFTPSVKWAHEERVLPIVIDSVICDFFLYKFHFHVQGSRPLWLINMFNFFNKKKGTFHPKAWENGHFTVSGKIYISEEKFKKLKSTRLSLVISTASAV